MPVNTQGPGAKYLIGRLAQERTAYWNEYEARKADLKAAAEGTISLMRTHLELSELLPPDEVLLGKAHAAMHALHEQIADRIDALGMHHTGGTTEHEHEIRRRVLCHVFCRNAVVSPPRYPTLHDSKELFMKLMAAHLVLRNLEDWGLIRKTAAGDFVRSSPLPLSLPSQTDSESTSHEESV